MLGLRAHATTAGLLVAAALAAALAGCHREASAPVSTVPDANPHRNEPAIAPAADPPGSIAEAQPFAPHQSKDGSYVIDLPADWAQTESGSMVTATSGNDGVLVAVQPAPVAPTAATARDNEAVLLQQHGRAVQILAVEDVTLPAGPAVKIRFTSNSEPDPATGRQLRLEDQTLLIPRAGQLYGVTMWAPQGAQTAAAWDRVAKSFRWP
jgi:hypothetical protein